MKTTLYTIVIIILTAVACCLILRSCVKPVSKENLHTETKLVLAKESKIHAREKKAKIIHDTVTKWRTRYKAVRYDSLIPCETKLVICDTIVIKDSLLISKLEGIQLTQDSVIKDWHTIHANDSTALRRANKEVKKQKKQKQLLAVIALVLGGYSIIK